MVFEAAHCAVMFAALVLLLTYVLELNSNVRLQQG
jgi:hypothetical protein